MLISQFSSQIIFKSPFSVQKRAEIERQMKQEILTIKQNLVQGSINDLQILFELHFNSINSFPFIQFWTDL